VNLSSRVFYVFHERLFAPNDGRLFVCIGITGPAFDWRLRKRATQFRCRRTVFGTLQDLQPRCGRPFSTIIDRLPSLVTGDFADAGRRGSYLRWCDGPGRRFTATGPQGTYIHKFGLVRVSQCPLQKRPNFESPRNDAMCNHRKTLGLFNHRCDLRNPESLSRPLTGRHSYIRRQPCIAGGEQTQS